MAPNSHVPRLGLLALAGAVLLGCPERKRDAGSGAAPSGEAPSGSVVAAPIEPESELMPGPHPETASHDGGADAAKSRAATRDPPRPLREDRAPPRDPLRGPEVVGVTLHAEWLWHETPAPHAGAEVASAALQAARRRTALTVTIDVSPIGRMRWVFEGQAFPLPAETELRARDDRYGHLLLWPGGRLYRVLPAGTLRAVLAERRADRMSLLAGTVREQKGRTLLGFETARVQVSAQLGTLTLEQAPVPGAGSGAPLLCRLLVELVGVEPSSAACSDGQLPLRAEFEWPDGGKLGFSVKEILRGQELALEQLWTPPPQAAFRIDGLPPPGGPALLSQDELHGMRTRDIESADEQDAGAPEQGVLAANQSDTLQYLLLDGVPAAWVPPRSEHHVLGPRPGRYVISWRDFLGLAVAPAHPVDVPCRVVTGEQPDAGASAGEQP